MNIKSILSALLMLTPTLSSANLIYQIDALQIIGDDSAAVSGYVTWDEALSTITNWHIETAPGTGVHYIFTQGAVFDANAVNDTMAGTETLQTFYTTTPSSEPHEFEIIWDSSPINASSVNGWSIKETWTSPDTGAGIHWRTGYVSVSLVSAIPIPAAVWLFGSGLLGLIGVARRKGQS